MSIKHWFCISKVAGREPVVLKPSSTKHLPMGYIKDTIYNIKAENNSHCKNNLKTKFFNLKYLL